MAELEKFIETDAEKQEIKIKNEVVSDYIIEIGESDIWTYRKWASGLAECWGTFVNDSVTMNTSWGNVYTAAINSSRVSYPFSFIERPKETVTIHTTTHACWLYAQASNLSTNTTDQTGVYYVARPNSISNAITVYLDFHVIGKWK